MLAWSCDWLQFLDTKVFFVNNKLSTGLYRKETDKNTLLKYDSCHPRRMVHSLPFSQMLWTRRIVESSTHIGETLSVMTQGFRERGYPQELINKHIQRVLECDRQQLLRQKKSTKSFTWVPFVS